MVENEFLTNYTYRENNYVYHGNRINHSSDNFHRSKYVGFRGQCCWDRALSLAGFLCLFNLQFNCLSYLIHLYYHCSQNTINANFPSEFLNTIVSNSIPSGKHILKLFSPYAIPVIFFIFCIFNFTVFI